MVTIFHIFRFLIFLIIIYAGFRVGYHFYGWFGVVLAIIPSVLISLVVTNIISLIENEAGLYLISRKSLAELEEYIKSDGIGAKYLAFIELKRRKVDVAQYKYVVDGLIESEIENERILGKTLNKQFFSNEK